MARSIVRTSLALYLCARVFAQTIFSLAISAEETSAWVLLIAAYIVAGDKE